MFGYIKPFKPQMKICEFEIYKAFYCGLCKQLGSVYGPFARLTLNYDFTFMSILLSGFTEDRDEFEQKRCFLKPFRKINRIPVNAGLLFSADVAIIMLYYKVVDNIRDGNIFQRALYLFISLFTSAARKKAIERCGEIDKILNDVIKNQFEIENNNTRNADIAAHSFANGMGTIFETFSGLDGQKRVLKRFGYLLGRYVYLIDALDDLRHDLKSKNYNPFITAIDEENCGRRYNNIPDEKFSEIREYAAECIRQTISEITLAYELIDIKKYKPILDNIIYMGLTNSLNSVLR